jgi:hypothetical protein
MNSTQIIIVVVLLSLWTSATPCEAQRVRQVQCALGESVQRAVNNAKAGDHIVVFGTCHEHILIPSSKTALTIRAGEQGAGITGVVSNRAVVDVRTATGLTFDGLIITGSGQAGPIDLGAAGIILFDGASATISRCVIESNQVSGVSVNASHAVLVGNTIRDNDRSGLIRIAAVDVVFNATLKLINNTIIGNHGDGVRLRAQSNGWFSGNSITANNADGVIVEQMSLANFEGAVVTITGNGGFGVACDNESRFVGGGFTASGNTAGDVRCRSTF